MGNCIGPMKQIMTLRLLILLLIIESSSFQLETQVTHGQLCWIPKTGKTSWLIYTPMFLILSYAFHSDLLCTQGNDVAKLIYLQKLCLVNSPTTSLSFPGECIGLIGVLQLKLREHPWMEHQDRHSIVQVFSGPMP